MAWVISISGPAMRNMRRQLTLDTTGTTDLSDAIVVSSERELTADTTGAKDLSEATAVSVKRELTKDNAVA